MTAPAQTTILDEVVVINLDVHIWSGRKKLRTQDLKLPNGTTLPPSTLASLGSKKICDPEEIKIFEKLKRQALRVIEESGIRFLGGYAIPKALAKQIVDEIETIRQEFLDRKSSFISRYNDIVSKWIKTNQEWSDIIQKAYTPVDVVESRIGFTQSMFQITPVEDIDNQLGDHVLSMSDQLYKEIALEAESVIDRSILPRNDSTASIRIIKPLLRMKKKLEGLSFLDSGVVNIIDELARVLLVLPKSGRITGVEFTHLYTLLITLSDKDKIRMLAKGLTTNQNATVAPIQTSDNENAQQTVKDNTVKSSDEPVLAVDNTTETVTNDDKELVQQEAKEVLPKVSTVQEPIAETTPTMVLADNKIEAKPIVEDDLSLAAETAHENHFVDKPEIFDSEEAIPAIDEKKSLQDVSLDQPKKVDRKKTAKEEKATEPAKKEKTIKKSAPPSRTTAPQPKNIQRPGTASAPQPSAIPCF